MSKKDMAAFALFIGALLLVCHMVIIADDVITVINDPNKQNKPGEVLKLAVDVTRYFG
jgi:hypothetical protein